MKNLFTLIFQWLTIAILSAQPNIEWEKCLGGSIDEHGRAVVQTTDGGFIVAGSATSMDGDITGAHGYEDFWVVKLSKDGVKEWQKALGGTYFDLAHDIQQTADGGYIVAGAAGSNNGDITSSHGADDVWVVKLSPLGAIEWQKTYGGSSYEGARSIRQTKDGGYIVGASTNSTNGDVFGNHGKSDFWILKLKEDGTKQWQKTIGGPALEYQGGIQQTSDEGYIVVGTINYDENDINACDFLVVKLSSSGAIEWQKVLGGSNQDIPRAVQQTSDLGYILAGFTSSSDGDVTQFKGVEDAWVVKLNQEGEIEWQKTVGGSINDIANAIEQTADGGYILAGRTFTGVGDVGNILNQSDFWAVKLDSSGTFEWQKIIGGSGYDYAEAVHQTNDGGYILAGTTLSTDGDVSPNNSPTEIWVVKLSPASVSTDNLPILFDALEIFPNPAQQSITIKMPEAEGNFQISLFNLLGQQVLSRSLLIGNSLDISTLPNGIYLITATSLEGKAYVQKFYKGDYH